MDKKETKQGASVFDVLIGFGFFFYFLILAVERGIGVTTGIFRGGEYSILESGKSTYSIFITCLCYLSLLAGIALSAYAILPFLKALFHKEKPVFDYKMLSLATGVILVGGMIHTGLTLSYLQFTAYGFLILSMIARTIEKAKGGKKEHILSLLYLVSYAMAVPVCYYWNLNTPLGIAYTMIQFPAMLVLVFFFSLLTYLFFQDGGVLDFSLLPFLSLILFDGLVIGLRFADEINYFVLIAAAATLVFYLLGLFLVRRGKVAFLPSLKKAESKGQD